MTDLPPDAPSTPTDAPSEQPAHSHSPLRASFVAVVLMAAFFVVTWGAVFAISLGRRG